MYCAVFEEMMNDMDFVRCPICDCYIKDIKKHYKTKKHLKNIDFIDAI